MIVELSFHLNGWRVPADHGYPLYAAVSRHVPWVHHPDSPVLIAPIRGPYVGHGLLALDPRISRLRLRLPQDQVPACMRLGGKTLEVDGHRLVVGVAEVSLLRPAPVLRARLVIIKGFTEPEAFRAAAQRQLAELGIQGRARLTCDDDGRPCRRVLRVHDRKVVGFGLTVSDLSSEHSLRLQEVGLGGRQRMGCGFFLPVGGPSDKSD
jgi:CRISPR-associated protein Cas6